MSEEARVGFLYKAASCLQQSGSPAQTILKSYYLMRCREAAKERGLPDKYFSNKVRCSRCFVEWQNDSVIKVRAIKLSKRQKRKIKHSKVTKDNKEYVESSKDLLHSNELEQICSFCKHSTITPHIKPFKSKEIIKNSVKRKTENEPVIEKREKILKKEVQARKHNPAKAVNVNVYSQAKDVFSLSNKNNILPSTVKEQKVIKNNKKKKDKFAGLCQQAVIVSAKLKQEKEKQNKLNLFLKPS